MGFGRVTFFIKDGRYMWTETYYAMDQNIGLADLLSQAQSLAVLRTQLMANYIEDPTGKTGVSLDEIRVSLDDTWRDSLIDPTYARGGRNAIYPKGPFNVARPERPYSCLLLRGSASQGGKEGMYRRSFYLAGVPENVIGDPNSALVGLNPNWWLSFSLFVGSLCAKPAEWGFKVRLKDQGSPDAPITNVFLPVGGGFVQATIPNTNWQQFDAQSHQQYLLIRGCKFDTPGVKVNGTQRFMPTPPVPPAVAIPGLYNLMDATGSGVYKGKGVARLLIYQVVKFDTVIPAGETSHKRGGRSNLPLGRLKKKV